MLSLVFHAGMEVVSIAEKYMSRATMYVPAAVDS